MGWSCSLKEISFSIIHMMISLTCCWLSISFRVCVAVYFSLSLFLWVSFSFSLFGSLSLSFTFSLSHSRCVSLSDRSLLSALLAQKFPPAEKLIAPVPHHSSRQTFLPAPLKYASQGSAHRPLLTSLCAPFHGACPRRNCISTWNTTWGAPCRPMKWTSIFTAQTRSGSARCSVPNLVSTSQISGRQLDRKTVTCTLKSACLFSLRVPGIPWLDDGELVARPFLLPVVEGAWNAQQLAIGNRLFCAVLCCAVLYYVERNAGSLRILRILRSLKALSPPKAPLLSGGCLRHTPPSLHGYPRAISTVTTNTKRLVNSVSSWLCLLWIIFSIVILLLYYTR